MSWRAGFLLGVLLALGADLSAAGWETLTNCRLESSEWNDGDSFHVRHAGKEYIFRLCYVDSPEVKGRKGQTERTSDQARYWKILKRDMYPLAKEASAYTQSLLANGFTVRTQWEDARGSSQLPRYFAVIETSQGDLAELLVANGYARIYGYFPDHPGGRNAKRYREKLEELEERAQQEEKGAWAFSKNKKTGKAKSKSKDPESSQKESPGEKSAPGKTRSEPDEEKQGLDLIPVF